MFRSFDRLQGFDSSAGRQKSASDFRGYSRNFARLSVVLSDEGVDVALRVGDVSQRQMNDAGAMPSVDFVFVDGSAHGPADFSPLLILGVFDRLFGQGEEALLQMFETDVAVGLSAASEGAGASGSQFKRP